jgi:hypothetical protein
VVSEAENAVADHALKIQGTGFREQGSGLRARPQCSG